MDSAIGQTKNSIRNSLARSHLEREGTGRGDPAIKRGENPSSSSIDGVTYKQIHSAVVCI